MKPLLYAAVVLGLSVSCKKQDWTTIVFGTVKNEINQPIEGVEMTLSGQKGVFQSRSTSLKNTKTDAKGEYSITIEIPKDYHSGDVAFNESSLFNMYEGGSLYFNGQQTKECCPVTVGKKSQYDFVLVRK